MESNKRIKTKKIIEEAMIQLLSESSFDQISTVKLTRAAGISRSSFYTHYRDKYDMIERYQERIFEDLEEIFKKTEGDRREAIIQVFELIQHEPLLAILLSENGTKEIQTFLRNKFQLMLTRDLPLYGSDSPQQFSPVEEEYRIIYLTNAYFGVCQTWLAHDTQESPQEMADFLMKMLQ